MGEVICYYCSGTKRNDHGNTCEFCDGTGYLERAEEELCGACMWPMDSCECPAPDSAPPRTPPRTAPGTRRGP
jgi:DnaJ-class molecular chaperone